MLVARPGALLFAARAKSAREHSARMKKTGKVFSDLLGRIFAEVATKTHLRELARAIAQIVVGFVCRFTEDRTVGFSPTPCPWPPASVSHR
jgi:hypothetical protein